MFWWLRGEIEGLTGSRGQAKAGGKWLQLLQDAVHAGPVRGLHRERLADDLAQHCRPGGGHLKVAVQDLKLVLHAKGQLAEAQIVQQASQGLHVQHDGFSIRAMVTGLEIGRGCVSCSSRHFLTATIGEGIKSVIRLCKQMCQVDCAKHGAGWLFMQALAA